MTCFPDITLFPPIREWLKMARPNLIISESNSPLIYIITVAFITFLDNVFKIYRYRVMRKHTNLIILLALN